MSTSAAGADAAGAIHLPDLCTGTGTLTPTFGALLCEAASYCFEHQSHESGVQMKMAGDLLVWPLRVTWVPVPSQGATTYSDPQFAVEFGAYGVAILLIEKFTHLTVVERSRKGTGFDYWLGPKGSATPLFQEKQRLEVSGLLEGDDSKLRSRMKKKLKQMEVGGIALPGFGAVVAFKAPSTLVVKT